MIMHGQSNQKIIINVVSGPYLAAELVFLWKSKRQGEKVRCKILGDSFHEKQNKKLSHAHVPGGAVGMSAQLTNGQLLPDVPGRSR